MKTISSVLTQKNLLPKKNYLNRLKNIIISFCGLTLNTCASNLYIKIGAPGISNAQFSIPKKNI